MTGDSDRARGGRAPVDDATKARVVQLAREGMSRNAVAREVGIAPRTVSRICEAAEPPVAFDRAQTAAAVAAHSEDAKAIRARLSQRALAKAGELLDLTEAPHEITHWDKDGFLHRAIIERPTAADIQRYLVAFGVAVDKHVALERHDGSDLELSAVDQFIRDVTSGLLA